MASDHLSEEFQFRALMENTEDSIYFKDRECRLMGVSLRMARNLGFTDPLELIGKTDIDLFGESFGRRTFLEDLRIMESNEPIIGLVESRRMADAGLNWTSTTKVPIHDASGAVVGLLGITREINDLKRAELDLQHVATHDQLTDLPNRYLLIDRLGQTFYVGGTNFTDLYYPSAGPSVTTAPGVCTMGACSAGNVGASCTMDTQCTQSINLDSSALSIGRGRRDIENLTQAASIDIPVIAFGGTNGLAPVPGAFTAFGTSIGVCTKPGCDGTPRVVDPSLPNTAFPTFGDEAGGFQVVLAEGFAHVDVLTAEDDANNPIPAALVDFIERNIQ